jgi:DNA-binding MarR family transcriptional regulator
MIPSTTGSTPSASAQAGLRGAQWVELICEISKYQQLVRNLLSERAGRWNLTDTEFLVLWLCRRAGPEGIAQHELATTVGISAAGMSGLVEKLRCRNLLDSRRSPRDRRRQLWQPTPSGAQILDDVCATLSQPSPVAGATISLDQQQTLLALHRCLTSTTDRSTGLALFQEDPPDREPCTEAHHENAHRRAV